MLEWCHIWPVLPVCNKGEHGAQVLNMMLNMRKEQQEARESGGQGVQWQRQRIIGRGWFKG